MDMLCIAAAHDPIGYVAVAGRNLDETSIARMTGGLESEVSALLGELERNGVFSRDRQGRIYSRRMVSDARRAAIARKNGKLGGNPTLGNNTEKHRADNPPDKAGVKTQEPRAIIQSEEDADASLSPEGDEKPEYPEAFEVCWKAYPHVKGRSSKPKALGLWKRITAGRRALLPAACTRYAAEGREPKADCGAPGMHLWLRDQKYLDWLQPIGSSPAAQVWNGPQEVPETLRKTLADQTDGYLRYFTWDATQRALVTTSPTMLAKLRDSLANLEKINVKVLLEKGRAA
jgi:hypothetical protein